MIVIVFEIAGIVGIEAEVVSELAGCAESVGFVAECW